MKDHQPPKLAQRLLKWYAGKADLEDLCGDLDEFYHQLVTSSGKRKAWFSYWKHVLSLLFSYALQKRKANTQYSTYYSSNSTAMLMNYVKIAVRNFSKHKLFTSLNVLGLALGMSVCLLALTISVAIYRSDEFHENKHRIYQVNTYIAEGEKDKTFGSTFHATGNYLKENYSFVDEVVNFRSDFHPKVDHNGNNMDFLGYFAEESFFDVFSFNLISGDPHTALAEPYSLVLTQKTAKKLFGDQNPLGEVVTTDIGKFKVTGVMKDLKQTHFFFEMLASYQTFRQIESSDLNTDWVNYRNHYSYILLQDEINKKQLDHALSETAQHASIFHPGKEIEFESVVLTGVVPRWNISNAIGIGWDQPSLIFFLTIGFLILLPAVFNHTNLSIARALKRAKEIGVRKVVGAEKIQIKYQFIVETMLMALVALGGAFMFMTPMKQEFLNMVYAAQVLDTDMNVYQITTFIVFALLVGLLAGIFPAQHFARLSPIQTLKGQFKNGKSEVSHFKKGLFVFQFFLSLVFIIGVAAIGKQYAYVLNNNHGFESANILALSFNGIDKSLAMNELGNHPHVKEITASSNLPGVFVSDRIQATSNNIDTIESIQVFITDHYIDHMKMDLVWGDSEVINRSNQNEELVLVNQQFISALKVFNVQKDTLRFNLADGTNCRVVGILKDFNFEPLTETIDPLIMRHSLEQSNYAFLTVSSPNIKRTLLELEDIWHTIDQKENFKTSFLDDEIEEAYYLLVAQLKFFSVLSILAITISCLGLLGMVSFTTENRTKEIAVRKIMGATNGSLYYLLTRDFLKLIGISALFAIPFSYFFYDKIFLYLLIRYGTGLGALEVIVSLILLFMVGAVTIYWQTAKVTKANPASKLRYE